MLCLFRGMSQKRLLPLRGSRALTDRGSNDYAATWPDQP